MNLRHQIVALAIVPLVLAILTVTAFITWQSTTLVRSSIGTFEQNMLKAKETELLNLTNLALSAIHDVYENAQAGDEAAKERVRAILTSLDYGQDGYFFVYDYDGNNIVHPRQTFRPGHNWLDLVDPDGDKVIANLIDKAKQGGGMHRYKWQKPSSGTMGDKLSFAVGLDKWRWMLGTGVYLDDVYVQTATANADFRANIRKTFQVVIMIAVPAVLIVFATGMLLTLRERRMADGKLKELTQRIIDTQEEERARLARELHDGISQNLVGVRYAIDLASRKVRNGGDDAAGAIDKGADALNVAIKEVRRLSHDLRPRVLDDLGLTSALQALSSNFAERTGIETSLDASAFDTRPKAEASTALYRVAQEALNNIERHSGASRAAIRLWSDRGRIRMTIEDNGNGFEEVAGKDRNAGGGLGLRNMQERMAHFDGLLVVKTAAQGTTLIATLPRSAAASADVGLEAA
ncbi:cache domain-containing protein [Phyllobacterium sp. 0TCS1.6C]|jgi:two-component system, NarL family, sensor kinase|uniref:cache domain-containing protein n=1 Tax=unclassified Phyllobacterium TaxID=2638441 RepID=UPI002263B28B|nr:MULTISPECIES: cache domain-containing protein [unclassified Phyllobacterium]MCX8282138.1 cache domain-containing protein [Phyllobacterium sp. 0TCS1.6C]MCX8296346.1 cache domain-containing protein [Phyllobacterium sp. 0TCS1.6A]